MIFYNRQFFNRWRVKMEVVAINVDIKVLVENRHLYTDDVKYNSLIVSNLCNKKINLLAFDTYALLDDDYKLKLFRSNVNFYNYILMKDGLYKIRIMDDFQYQPTDLRCWGDCVVSYFIYMFVICGNKILTIVE